MPQRFSLILGSLLITMLVLLSVLWTLGGPNDDGRVLPPISTSTPDKRLTTEALFPNYTFSHPTDAVSLTPDIMLISEKDGRIFKLDQSKNVGGSRVLILDLRERTNSVGLESGLLGLAVDPGYPAAPYLYTYRTVGDIAVTVSRFVFQGDVIELTSEVVVDSIPWLAEQHFGGGLRFGRNGLLFYSTGDTRGFHMAQDEETPYGKVFAIDPHSSNPVRRLVATGFRNPWRLTYDPAADVLWAVDAGEDSTEELNQIKPGGNYGWPYLEGTTCYRGTSKECAREDLTPPVAGYPRSEGRCVIVGGAVYRGSEPEIADSFVFGDHCSGEMWALPLKGGPVRPLAVGERGPVNSLFMTDANGDLIALRFFDRTVVRFVSR